MLRILFDTSVYAELIIEKNTSKIVNQIKEDSEVMVKGFEIIRIELRQTPKKIIIQKKNLRNSLLELYDNLIRGKQILYSEKINQLAKEYYNSFKKNKGGWSWDKLKNDFRIIACASIHGIDIVYSKDKKTMLSPIAIKSYMEVNLIKKYRDPNFKFYEDLKKIYKF